MQGRIRQLLLIGGAALILAAITEQWVARLPAAASAATAGVRLDEPPPWSTDEPGNPDSTSVWPRKMFIAWVRVFAKSF